MTTRRVLLTLPLGFMNPASAQSILDLAPPPSGKRIAYGADQFQFGELRAPAGNGPHPAAIVIHGGYWRAKYDLTHLGHMCQALAREGIATWSLEYRRLGNAGGGWPGTFDDIRAGAAHLSKIANEHKLDPNRVIAMGHSAGGHLCLWLAKQRVIALRGVVPLAPLADLRRAAELKLSDSVVEELLGGSPSKLPERYRAASPIELVPLGVTQRLLHGKDDDIVPISISRDYLAAARKAGDDATLQEIPGAGHFELIDPRSPAWTTVKSAVLALVQ
jgi:acetyl esterase/lipase